MMNPAEIPNIGAAERDHWWYRGMREILFRILDPLLEGRRVGRALDAGCGTGYMAGLIEARGHWRLFPVDIGWKGLEFARRLGVGRLTQADIARLPFRDGVFDLVLSLDVLVHAPRGEEERSMAEMARVAAPGSLVVLRVAAFDILRSRHSDFIFEKQRYRRPRLVRLAETHGFRVLRATYCNSLLLPVALFMFRIWEPLLRKPPSTGVHPLPGWLDALLGLALKLEAAWLGAGLNFPVGQSLLLLAEKTGAAAPTSYAPASDRDSAPNRTV